MVWNLDGTKMQDKADKKNLKFGPQVKLLMDVLGETMDDIINEPTIADDDEEIDIENELDEFHDTSQQQE